MKLKSTCLLAAAAIMLNGSLSAQQSKRADIPEKYKWNLNELYSSVSEWQKEKDAIEKDISKVTQYKGKLGESSKTLESAMKEYFDLLKRLYKFSSYASQLSDENLKISQNQALSQQASIVFSKFAELTSFISPEILKIDDKVVDKYLSENKGLDEYKMFINDIRRLKAHTLSEKEEALLASFGLSAETPSTVYGIFNNAEMPYASVKLSDGSEAELSSASFTKYRQTDNREDRAKVFKAFFENYGRFQNTIAANYAGKLKNDYIFAKSRNYSTALEASLGANNVPVSVYENLVAQINNSLPTLQRFLQLKKKMLGVDTLHYYDLYTSMVKKTEMNFNIDEGQKLSLLALKPLGDEYLATVQKAYDNRWIDYYPTEGKRSGAYSSGAAYDIHPYILTNWMDNYESLSTLVHEMGHTMHSYYSNSAQPFSNSNYSIFVAEIASTLNENLLNRYMVDNSKSREEKLYLLGSYLELLRTTIFRQTLFAEFELDVHKLIEKGESVTGEQLSEMYLNLVRKYYGHDKGICIVDPYIAYEWAYIPHFVNYTYYVYQYSTSLIYSTAFAEKIFESGKPAVDNYFKILKGGSSMYPVDLIKSAGIDPMSKEPFELTMKKMNDVMDQMEKLIK